MIQTAWCGTMEETIYSGTAVVDHNNSLGKQVGDTKTLVAFFTYAVEPLFHQLQHTAPTGAIHILW
jgi:fructan beta-fructosidase